MLAVVFYRHVDRQMSAQTIKSQITVNNQQQIIYEAEFSHASLQQTSVVILPMARKRSITIYVGQG